MRAMDWWHVVILLIFSVFSFNFLLRIWSEKAFNLKKSRNLFQEKFFLLSATNKFILAILSNNMTHNKISTNINFIFLNNILIYFCIICHEPALFLSEMQEFQLNTNQHFIILILRIYNLSYIIFLAVWTLRSRAENSSILLFLCQT